MKNIIAFLLYCLSITEVIGQATGENSTLLINPLSKAHFTRGTEPLPIFLSRSFFQRAQMFGALRTIVSE